MSDLNELLERVKKATGPDREIDWLIADYLGIPEPWPTSTLWPPFMDGSKFGKSIPLFSASIDAAVALVERVLRPEHPGMTMELRFVWAGRDDRGWCRAEITWPSHEFIGHASSPQLAMIEALLSALISKETQS